ncbi:MAG: peptide-methionine (R)-S-oxide reductase MsrB [Terriglobales bacterium]
MPDKIVRSEAEWRTALTPEEYHITRERGTEPAFTGRYWNEHANGVYHCTACGAALFDSATKFESGTGWPSFFAPIAAERVELHEDSSHGMRRIEVVCATCGSHLGHRFPDGPPPSGQRYCLNSAALRLEPATSSQRGT